MAECEGIIIRIIGEEELPNGDSLITFETSEENMEKLREIFGEPFDENMSKAFAEYVKNLIDTKGETDGETI